eukprot:SAG11_NODE_3787_length_2225_cov_14.781750_2_plen_70_part_00
MRQGNLPREMMSAREPRQLAVVVIWGVLAHGPRIAQKLPPNQGNARASRRAKLGALARRNKMLLHHQAI